METKFNFNSQICTSREQSERLLALGLKKETADMTWEFSHTKNGVPQYDCRAESSWDSETFARYVEHCEKIGYFEHWKHEDGSQMTPEEVYDEIMKIHIPAWSLGRLWELLDKIKKYEGEDELSYPRISLVEEDVIIENPKSIWVRRNFCSPKGVYENIINCLEELITEGYFPKEYLE